ncbi:hypothetical protein [Bacillus sp. FJAT-28004]|uniref:hypothetical protein n=1 Tax=Bacillus sp. FJAT-28004 TaxID=1679165 RepID=UPI000A799142|nr:hypothetical protein [Bacillus sp. FJAT-28004]
MPKLSVTELMQEQIRNRMKGPMTSSFSRSLSVDLQLSPASIYPRLWNRLS